MRRVFVILMALAALAMTSELSAGPRPPRGSVFTGDGPLVSGTITLPATVFIVVSMSVPWACASEKTSRQLTKWADGIYRHVIPAGMMTDLMFRTCETSQVEEWTNLPENGGRFIRALTNNER